MERQLIVNAYNKAFLLWKQKRVIEAQGVLNRFWQETGMQSLRVMLLMAYILRDQQKYVSEVKVLEELFEHFSDSGEVKLLADAWSLMGASLRCLGDSELSVAAFKKAVALEPNQEKKLVECSNAIFSANAIEGVTADYMQSLYALYRDLLDKLPAKPYPLVGWQHKKIRVGYISADLRAHAVAQFVWRMLCQYDREKFTVYVYSLTRHPDRVTGKLQQGGAVWRDVAADCCPDFRHWLF